MIALKYNNSFLDLGASSTTIKMTSPLFDTDRAGRIYSFPFNIPNTDHNRKVTQNVHRIDNRGKQDKAKGILYTNNQPHAEGVIRVKKKQPKQLQIYFQNDQLDFLTSLADVNIHEILDTETWQQDPAPYLRWEFEVVMGGSFYYEIIIRGEVFAYTANSNTTQIEIVTALTNNINAVFPGLCPSGTSPTHLIVQSFEQEPALISFEALTNNLVLDVEEVFAVDQRTQFLGYLNALRNTPSPRLCFPTHRNLQFYKNSDNLAKFKSFINVYHSDSYQMPAPEANNEWENTFVPFVKLKYALEKLVQEVGYLGIKGDILQINEFEELAIYNNRALDKVMFEHTSAGRFFFNYFKPEIDLNNHVPEMDGQSFFVSILEDLGLYYEVKGSYVHLQRITAPAKQPAIDWTTKAKNNYTVEVTEKKGVTLAFQKDPDEDRTNLLQQNDLIVGAGETLFQTTWGTLDTDIREVNQFQLMPITAQLGYSDALQGVDGDYTPRLILFKGFYQGSNAEFYPFATSGTQDYLGNEIGDIALAWDGPKGLYETLHRGRVDILDKSNVVVEVDLEATEIQQIVRWRNSRRRIEFPDGTVDGVIVDIAQRISNQRKSIITVTLRLLF